MLAIYFIQLFGNPSKHIPHYSPSYRKPKTGQSERRAWDLPNKAIGKSNRNVPLHIHIQIVTPDSEHENDALAIYQIKSLGTPLKRPFKYPHSNLNPRNGQQKIDALMNYLIQVFVNLLTRHVKYRDSNRNPRIGN